MAGEDSDEDFLSPKTRKTRKTMEADESANMEQAHKMQRLSTKAASLQAQLTVAIGQLQHATAATMSNLETTAKQKLGDGSRVRSPASSIARRGGSQVVSLQQWYQVLRSVPKLSTDEYHDTQGCPRFCISLFHMSEELFLRTRISFSGKHHPFFVTTSSFRIF